MAPLMTTLPSVTTNQTTVTHTVTTTTSATTRVTTASTVTTTTMTLSKTTPRVTPTTTTQSAVQTPACMAGNTAVTQFTIMPANTFCTLENPDIPNWEYCKNAANEFGLVWEKTEGKAKTWPACYLKKDCRKVIFNWNSAQSIRIATAGGKGEMSICLASPNESK